MHAAEELLDSCRIKIASYLDMASVSVRILQRTWQIQTGFRSDDALGQTQKLVFDGRGDGIKPRGQKTSIFQ